MLVIEKLSERRKVITSKLVYRKDIYYGEEDELCKIVFFVVKLEKQFLEKKTNFEKKHSKNY